MPDLTPEQRAALGPYGFPEIFVPTGSRYELDDLFTAMREAWENNA